MNTEATILGFAKVSVVEVVMQEPSFQVIELPCSTAMDSSRWPPLYLMLMQTAMCTRLQVSSVKSLLEFLPIAC